MRNIKQITTKSLQVTVMIGIVIFSLSFMLILIVLKSIFGVSVLDYGLSSSISSENFELQTKSYLIMIVFIIVEVVILAIPNNIKHNKGHTNNEI